LDAHTALLAAQDGSVCNMPPGLDLSSFVECMDMSIDEFAAEYMIESEQEILFLVRHFADNIASW
jgi:hypothetical protein